MLPVGRWLPRSPALLGGIYLALVPAFGIVYAILGAHSFRDANIEAEHAMNDEGQKLARVLGRDVALRAAPRASWRIGGATVRLEPQSVRGAGLLHTQDGRLLFEVSGGFREVRPASARGFGQFEEWVDLDVGFGGYLETIPPRGRAPSVTLAVSLARPEPNALPPTRPGSTNPPVPLLFPLGAPGLSTAAATSGFFTLPLGHFNRVVRFYDALQGDPYFAPHRVLWTLYFSAVTITTLGFGDITPVSATARVLTGSEAVLGVVLVGLFLNALAGRALSGSDAGI